MRKLSLLLVVTIGATVFAQEVVTYRPRAVDRAVNISGERVAYLDDGGCTCQAETRIPTEPRACNGGACMASRLRSTLGVVDALDAGADAR